MELYRVKFRNRPLVYVSDDCSSRHLVYLLPNGRSIKFKYYDIYLLCGDIIMVLNNNWEQAEIGKMYVPKFDKVLFTAELSLNFSKF